MKPENLSFAAMARVIVERDTALQELDATTLELIRTRRIAFALASHIQLPDDRALNAGFLEALKWGTP